MTACDECNATGFECFTLPIVCAACEGTGFLFDYVCSECQGCGILQTESHIVCAICKGTGQITSINVSMDDTAR
jgi:DnaJ-class molecular chaperone